MRGKSRESKDKRRPTSLALSIDDPSDPGRPGRVTARGYPILRRRRRVGHTAMSGV